MSEKRGPWFLLTGAVIGIVIGLLVGWVVVPVQYVDTTPATLRADFKDQYRLMIAAAYSANSNLERARARLGLLGDPDPARALGDQAQRMLANNASQEVVSVLGNLAQALQTSPGVVTPTSSSATVADTPAQETTVPTPAGASPTVQENPASSTNTPTPTSASTQADTPATPISTPNSTATPRPTHTPTATPGAPFALANKSTFCEATQPGLVQIFLEDARGEPAAGVELVVTWSGGEEHFFTGLKPEIGNGYADFVMSADVEYALSMSAGGTRVAGLIPPSCTTPDGAAYPGGIRLEFKQP